MAQGCRVAMLCTETPCAIDRQAQASRTRSLVTPPYMGGDLMGKLAVFSEVVRMVTETGVFAAKD